MMMLKEKQKKSIHIKCEEITNGNYAVTSDEAMYGRRWQHNSGFLYALSIFQGRLCSGGKGTGFSGKQSLTYVIRIASYRGRLRKKGLPLFSILFLFAGSFDEPSAI